MIVLFYSLYLSDFVLQFNFYLHTGKFIIQISMSENTGQQNEHIKIYISNKKILNNKFKKS